MTQLRILVVDDERGMRKAIERTLESFSVETRGSAEPVIFEVDLASSGEEALEIIEKRRPDILLLDYKLPGISGLEVLQRVARPKSEMLTVMITAYASIETAVAATKQGAHDFLPKPFTPDDLRHTIRKAAVRIMLARRARDLQQEKRRVRFEFIRVLGHELKAPLSAVSGYLHLMHDQALGTDLDTYGSSIERGLDRLEQMRKLIDDLLDMTRIEAGESTREFEDVDLADLASQSILLVEHSARERKLRFDLTTEGDMRFHAVRAEMEIVINNMVSNAVKYNRDKGAVDIRICRQKDKVTIQVQDTGIGMTEAECGRLFGEFVRIRNQKTRNILGSGLGLSIVKRLAEMYQGTVGVESQPDEGSTFTVTLKEAA